MMIMVTQLITTALRVKGKEAASIECLLVLGPGPGTHPSIMSEPVAAQGQVSAHHLAAP